MSPPAMAVPGEIQMNLILVPGKLEQIIQHATDAYPNEGCGLLVGRGSAERFIPMKNILSARQNSKWTPQN